MPEVTWFKMATLPFVVQPRRKPILERIGSEESGIIEVERRGYLTTGEKSFVQQVQGIDSGASEMITLSRVVARRYSLGMDKAYTLVLSIVSGAQVEPSQEKIVNEIELEFAEDLTAVVKGLGLGQAREDLVMAACLLKYRVDPDFAIADISDVHPDIISGLAALYRQEELKQVEAFADDDKDDKPEKKPSVEEAEKKPVKTTGSRSKSTTGG
jgi:hypothetical protein